MSYDPKNHTSNEILMESILMNKDTNMVFSVKLQQCPSKHVLEVVKKMHINTGSAYLSFDLDANHAAELIALLQNHIEAIKEAEIELIALHAKAAA